MAPFDRPYTTFYWSAIVNIASDTAHTFVTVSVQLVCFQSLFTYLLTYYLPTLSCTVFELSDVE